MQIIVYINETAYIIACFIYTDYTKSIHLSIIFFLYTDVHFCLTQKYIVMRVNTKCNDYLIIIHSADISSMILSLLDAKF